MCPDKKRPAENICRIVKGLDAVWAHFCPPKPCLPLSIDGSVKGNRQGSLLRSITRRSDQNRKIKYCFYFAILPQLVKKVRTDFFDKLERRAHSARRFCALVCKNNFHKVVYFRGLKCYTAISTRKGRKKEKPSWYERRNPR